MHCCSDLTPLPPVLARKRYSLRQQAPNSDHAQVSAPTLDSSRDMFSRGRLRLLPSGRLWLLFLALRAYLEITVKCFEFPAVAAYAIMIRMSDLNRINSVVFDMDGLLLDSERVVLEDFIDSCREFGFEPDVEVYYRCIGGNKARTREIMLEGYGPDFPYDAVNELWYSKAGKKPMPLKPGAVDLLRFLDRRGMKKAVVTSSHRDWAVKILSDSGILPFFDFVLGGDQIHNSKPHPEIYLAACEKLGEAPADCLALEDSDNGALSASAAGLAVIQVPDLLQPSEAVRELGHRIVHSLVEVEKLLSDGVQNEA